MSVLMTSPLFRPGSMALAIADESESPLMRWAAQSAEMSLVLIPQTFSVYVLKKIWKRRRPNWFTTQSSNEWGFGFGKARALKYDSTQRAASTGPSFARASVPLSG